MLIAILQLIIANSKGVCSLFDIAFKVVSLTFPSGNCVVDEKLNELSHDFLQFVLPSQWCFTFLFDSGYFV